MISKLVGCSKFYGLIVIDRKIYAGGQLLSARNLLFTARSRWRTPHRHEGRTLPWRPSVALLRPAGFPPTNISFRSAQLETVQSLVRAGVGISLVPAMVARSERRDLPEYRSLPSPRPERKIVTFWPKQRPPGRAANEFLKLVSACFEKPATGK
jgi:DNA-binding transcriptional LysR family regulator